MLPFAQSNSKNKDRVVDKKLPLIIGQIDADAVVILGPLNKSQLLIITNSNCPFTDYVSICSRSLKDGKNI